MPKVQIISKTESFEVAIGESVFVLRRPSRQVLAEIRKRHTRRVTRDEPGAFPEEVVDDQAIEQDMVDYVIQAWRGVAGPDGQDVPCTEIGRAHV